MNPHLLMLSICNKFYLSKKTFFQYSINITAENDQYDWQELTNIFSNFNLSGCRKEIKQQLLILKTCVDIIIWQ